jgi:hypothetical protein
MQEAYGFRPSIALGDGLERFRAWMERQARPALHRKGSHVVE